MSASSLADAGRQLVDARRSVTVATAHAKEQAIAAREEGEYEHVIAALLHVNRATVRRWLGK